VRPLFHSFWEPIRVQQLQLLITDWHITPCLSVGLFGCRNSEGITYIEHVRLTILPVGDADTTPMESVSSSDGVCSAPSNNVILSCVGVEEIVSNNNDTNVSTIMAIVLSICLVSLLMIIATIYLWRITKKKLSEKKQVFYNGC